MRWRCWPVDSHRIRASTFRPTSSAYAVGEPKLVIYWVSCLAQWAVVHLSWAHTTEANPGAPSAELASDWLAVVGDLRDRGRP